MDNRLNKIKLKGNESFNFREGWLRKGIRNIEEYPDFFSRNDVMERLGVGSKMVKSIKYWLRATGLCEEKIERNNRKLFLTADFGEIITEYDKYFDDIATLYLIHYKIVQNEELCIVWNIFFNDYSPDEFGKDDMVNACMEYLNRRIEAGASFSEKSFADDCASLLRMYLKPKTMEDPEESLVCPLSELGLINRSAENRNLLVKCAPPKGKLDKLVVLYVIIDNLTEEKTSVSIDDLLNAPNNIGRVFNLDRAKINDYLDQLRASGFLTINRTAGLDMVYIKNELDAKQIIELYYSSVQEN